MVERKDEIDSWANFALLFLAREERWRGFAQRSPSMTTMRKKANGWGGELDLIRQP
jgi:hypothetical protein